MPWPTATSPTPSSRRLRRRSDGKYNGIDPIDVAVTNIDNNTVGIIVNPTSGLTTTEAGGTAAFSVVLNSQPTADVTIGLSSTDTTEGTISPVEPHLHERELERAADRYRHRRQRRPGRRRRRLHHCHGGGDEQTTATTTA